MGFYKVVTRIVQAVVESPGMKVGDAVKKVVDATGLGKGFRTDKDGCGCYGRQRSLNRFKLPG